jgi:hypothetical protein
MTIPAERTRSLKNTRAFLLSLLYPKETPKVPLKIRRAARQMLRHFPSEFEIEEVTKIAPQIFGKD